MKKIVFAIVLAFTLFLFLLFLLRIVVEQSRPHTSIIFQEAKQSLNNASWGNPTDATEQTSYGKLSGEKISGSLTTNQANIPHFENVQELKKLGYTVDNNIAADGPGSSMWGYKKSENGKTQILIYSYSVQPTSTNPNEPIQFNCPCQATVSVFISNVFQQQDSTNTNGESLANPASTNCAKEGGTTVIKNGPNGQYGLCQFEDNMACEEWALFRGQCPVGGVKTTGFDTIQQMYCAWVGGQTLAVPNAQCTLPNGTVCSDEALYNGTCPIN